MNMFLSPGMPHMAPPSGDKKRSAATNSPFREWATSQLGCLGDEIDSPGQAIAASQSILSPGYGDMPVKMCVSLPKRLRLAACRVLAIDSRFRICPG